MQVAVNDNIVHKESSLCSERGKGPCMDLTTQGALGGGEQYEETSGQTNQMHSYQG